MRHALALGAFPLLLEKSFCSFFPSFLGDMHLRAEIDRKLVLGLAEDDGSRHMSKVGHGPNDLGDGGVSTSDPRLSCLRPLSLIGPADAAF